MSTEKPYYQKKKDDAERKSKEAADETNREEIVASLERVNKRLDRQEQQSKSRDKRQRRIEHLRFRLEQRRFWIDVTAVIAACAALVFLIGQDALLGLTVHDSERGTKKAHFDNGQALARADTANRQAQEFFEAGQAPMIWHAQDANIKPLDALNKPVWTMKDGHGRGVIVWNWHWENYGNGIALGLSDMIVLFIRGTPCYPLAVMRPGAPLPPHGVYYTAADCKPWRLSKSEFEKLRKTDDTMMIQGAVTYHDAFGNKYETTICYENFASGAIHECPGNAYKRIKS